MTLSTDKLRKYILPNLPYALIFWFFTKAGEAYRLATGGDFFSKLINCVSRLGTALAHPCRPSSLSTCWCVAGAAVIYAVVYVRKKNAKKWRKDVEYGSARWAAERTSQKTNY